MDLSNREEQTLEALQDPGRRFGDLLQDMVLESQDIEDFLTDLAHLSASQFSVPGSRVLCGVTLLRERQAATVASSGAQSRMMDEIQYAFHDGLATASAQCYACLFLWKRPPKAR